MKKEPTILEPWLSVEPWRYANDATDEESLIAARLASPCALGAQAVLVAGQGGGLRAA